jgi:hypothetical protein
MLPQPPWIMMRGLTLMGRGFSDDEGDIVDCVMEMEVGFGR